MLCVCVCMLCVCVLCVWFCAKGREGEERAYRGLQLLKVGVPCAALAGVDLRAAHVPDRQRQKGRQRERGVRRRERKKEGRRKAITTHRCPASFHQTHTHTYVHTHTHRHRHRHTLYIYIYIIHNFLNTLEKQNIRILAVQ